MQRIDSAVALTKFLHSKDVPKNELIEVATEFSEGKLPVQLPQKQRVVLDWIFDKLVKKNASEWRLDGRAWSLVAHAWSSLDDSDSKTRLSETKDFVGLISEALYDFSTSYDPECIEAFVKATSQIVIDLTWSRPSNAKGQKLISCYLGCSLSRTDGIAQISKVLHQVLITPFPLLVTKKSKTYDDSIFIPALRLLSRTGDTIMDSIVETVIKEGLEHHEGSIGPQIEKLKALESESTALASASKLFEIIVKFFGSTSAQRFVEIIAILPGATLSLLDISVKSKTKINVESLHTIVDNGIEQRKPDWNLMTYVLDLNSDVILSRADKLFAKVEGHDTNCTRFICGMIRAYAQSRDLPLFISKWLELAKVNKFWEDATIVKTVISELGGLSVTQLGRVLDDVSQDGEPPAKKRKTKDTSSRAPALAVAKHLINSRAVDDTIRNKLSKLLDMASGGLGDWELKFIILSIDASFASEHRRGLLASIAGSDLQGSNAKGLLETLFRLQELGDTDHLNEFGERILGLMSNQPKLAPELLSAITERWLLLVNRDFSDQNLTLLSQLYIQHSSELMNLVSSAMFFEQTRLVREMINEMSRQISGDESRVDDIVLALVSFPMEVFTRASRVNLIDLLVPRYETSAEVLVILTQWPTFGTELEQDPKVICKMCSRYPSKALFRVLGNLVHNSVVSSDTEKAKIFLKKLIERSIKKLSSSEEWVLQLSCVILESAKKLAGNENFSSLKIQLLKSYFQALDTKAITTHDTLDRLISVLPLLKDVKRIEKLSDIASQNLESSLAGGNFDLAVRYFSIICHTTQVRDNDDLKLITSHFAVLHTILKTEHDLKLLSESYSLVLSKISDAHDVTTSLIIDAFYRDPSGLPHYMAALKLILLKQGLVNEEHFIEFLSRLLEKQAQLGPSDLGSALSLIEAVLKSQPKLVTQYGLELILTFISSNLSPDGPSFSCDVSVRTQLYVDVTLVTSAVLLFHRHRLSGRHHLVMKCFELMLQALSNPSGSRNDRSVWLAGGDLSAEASLAFSRLVENLCEPPIQAIREKSGQSNLTSSSSLTKAELSKFISSFLLSYVHMSLHQGFASHHLTNLAPALYPVFDVLGEKVKIASAMMDASARAILRPLYEDYLKNGKWKED